ncbi:CMP-binding factor [Lactobacillus selangorensis]|uniref:CMP-binding factor n=1 Tax=Lactobacillus selangorensis TaxID=81857 RepID=A0A0R2FIV6_9LACO|nr:HD domain-containing protein [Lactobacillus selangorensis]KRN28591.1 CMP-binding factor [Lactobacillus selangorensis]KRN32999.1 CMP-binding factor [Lactobacillus selangorensis]
MLFQVADQAVVQGTAVLQEIKVQATKNGKSQYASGVLVTPDEKVPVKIWDVDDTINQLNNHVVDFTAQRNDYNGQLQFVVQKLAANEQASIRDYLPSSYWSRQEVAAGFKHFLGKITDPLYHQVVNACYKQVDQEITDPLFDMPAAVKMHHAFIGGLYTHTLSMAYEAEGILAHTIYRQDINESLLYAGILLHDLGKAYCYTNATDHEETRAGSLLDHVAIMDGMLVEQFEKILQVPYGDLLKNEKVTLLRHMILSHHGKLEWGAAIKPATLEAQLLHQVDLADSRLEMARETLDQQAPDTFSDRQFGLDGARLYKETPIRPQSQTTDTDSRPAE